MYSGDLSTQWDLMMFHSRRLHCLGILVPFFRLLFCTFSCCCLLSFNMHLYFASFSSISFGISIGNRQLVAKRTAVILYNCIAWWLMFDRCNTLHVTGSNCWRVTFILFDCWASGLIVWNRFQVFIFHTALKCTADSRSAIILCNSFSYWASQMLIWCKVRVIKLPLSQNVFFNFKFWLIYVYLNFRKINDFLSPWTRTAREFSIR